MTSSKLWNLKRGSWESLINRQSVRNTNDPDLQLAYEMEGGAALWDETLACRICAEFR